MAVVRLLRHLPCVGQVGSGIARAHEREASGRLDAYLRVLAEVDRGRCVDRPSWVRAWIWFHAITAHHWRAGALGSPSAGTVRGVPGPIFGGRNGFGAEGTVPAFLVAAATLGQAVASAMKRVHAVHGNSQGFAHLMHPRVTQPAKSVHEHGK